MPLFFTGGPDGFIKGGYPVWLHGIPASYTEQQKNNKEKVIIINKYATVAGLRAIDGLRNIKTSQSTASRFLRYLQQIIEQEKKVEEQHLQVLINKLENAKIQTDSFNAAKEAFNRKDFSSAYTFLMKYKNSLEEMREEVKKSQFQDISHMKAFWHNELNIYIKELLDEKTEVIQGQWVAKAGFNVTFEELIDGFIKYVIESEPIDGVQTIRENMLKNLLSAASKIEGTTLTGKDYLFTSNGRQQRLRGGHGGKLGSIKTRGNKDKTVSTLIRELANNIIAQAGRGMGAELGAYKQANQFGSSIATGSTKLKGKQIKTDILSFTVAEATIKTEDIVKELYEPTIDNDAKKINEILQDLDAKYKTLNESLFAVFESVKGYQSQRDLHIASSASFKTNEERLHQLIDNADLPGSSIDKLIFLLNNTAQGCIMSKQLHILQAYLGTLCAVWLFDNYISIYQGNVNSSSGFKQINLFVSGGIYYCLSDILQRTYNELEKALNNEKNINSLFDIIITPPGGDFEAQYQSLIEDYPINDFLKSPNDESYGEIQENLQLRWDAMRNLVQEKGQLEILMRKSNLESLVGTFQEYLELDKSM